MKYIAFFFISLFYKLFWIFKIKNNKVVVVSFFGKGYGDSGKYICNELNKRNKNIDIVWLSKNTNSKFPEFVRVVKYNSIKSFYELATAKVWIDNSRKRPYITKRKNQFYMQTWHSNLRLKKIEKDAKNDLDKQYIWYAKRDSKMADAIIAGCDFSYNTIKNSFWYNGPIYKTGIPRCDELFNNDKNVINNIKNKLNINDINNIILYAPTFRKNHNVNLDDINDLITALKNKYKNDFILLVRFHPISKQVIKDSKYIKNVTNYPDMQELIKICTILVTDYSGCMFDAAIAHKKCILYIPDYEDYINNQRELYFDFKTLPFDKTYTFKELGNAITNINDNLYEEKINNFLSYINCYEKGDSAKNVTDIIEGVLNNEKI